MPSFSISDAASLRLDAISFFLLLMIIGAFALRWSWNSLQVQFENLPKLSVVHAFALMFLWGMVFVLILTMVSGARELMTPKAWERNGWTHQIIDPSADSKAVHLVSLQERKDRLEFISRELRRWCRGGQLELPKTIAELELAPSRDHPPGHPLAEYLYDPSLSDITSNAIVREPNLYSEGAWGVTLAGELVSLTADGEIAPDAKTPPVVASQEEVSFD